MFEDFFYHHGGFVKGDAKLIQIDINASEIGKSEPVDIGIVSAPGPACAEIAECVSNKATPTQLKSVATRYTRIKTSNAQKLNAWNEQATANWDRVPIDPASFGKALGMFLPKNANVFNDSISSSANVQMGIAHRSGLNVLGPRGGAIGWGMGSTLGLHLANPGDPTFGIVGDGSAMMTVQALWTAVNYDIPVTFLICNNASYRVLKVNQNHYHRMRNMPPPEIYNAADFDTPLDFRGQAEAYGAVGTRVEHLDELAPAIESAAASPSVNVIDVILDSTV